MKVRLIFEYDTSDGDYSMEVNNLSNPGQGIPLENIKEAIRRITGDVERQATGLPEVSETIEREDN
jgi:predicted RNase H-like HicB family nuclease